MATGAVLTDDSLSRRPEGLGIALTVPGPRRRPSSVSRSGHGRGPAGTRRDPEGRAGRQTYTVAELPEQWDTLWFIQDRLVVHVPYSATPLHEPVPAGAEVDVEVTVDLRLPYMQIAPMTYVTNHAANRRTLAAR